MQVRMAKLERTPSGQWASRKVIPQDVRTAYGKREEKPRWPATLSPSEARSQFTAWLAAVEARITNLRKQAKAGARSLTHRETVALAGRWYRDLVRRFEDEPGSEVAWERELDDLQPEQTDADYQDYLRGGSQKPYEGPWRIVTFVADECTRLLERESLKLDDRSAAELGQRMADLYHSFCTLMIRRAGGDYGEDPVLAGMPDWKPAEPVRVRTNDGATITELFDRYVAERKPAPATEKAWRRLLGHLRAYLGHDDATRVTPKDIVGWKDKLLAEPNANGELRTARTVNDTYLAAARTVLGWGVENHLLASNPAAMIKVRVPKRQRLRDPGFSDEEARTILAATLAESPNGLSQEYALARRWVPWLCAYTGARVNEITQLRAQDVAQVDGIWTIRITPEAGSVKNNEARIVPLHPHLIEQGFLEVVQAKREGALFYNPARHRGGRDGNPQYKKVGERLAKWVRMLGVDDSNVQPNHAWRHRFKTVSRQVGMDPEARAVIPGHAPASEGESYGGWPVAALLAEIEKLPRYEVGARPGQ